MSTKDYYKILQVAPTADPEVISAAYRILAHRYHPDINRSPDATLRMQEINEAYEVLSDPVKRTEYDRERVAPVRLGSVISCAWSQNPFTMEGLSSALTVTDYGSSVTASKFFIDSKVWIFPQF